MSNVKEKTKLEIFKNELTLLCGDNFEKDSNSAVAYLKSFISSKENNVNISLYKFSKMMWKCTRKFINEIEKYEREIQKCFIFLEGIYLREDFIYMVSGNGTEIMKIDCRELLKLEHGDISKFEKIKKYIIEWLPRFKKYENFLNTFENTIKIGEISKIIISNKFGLRTPSIVLEIGSIASLEIQYRSQSLPEIITYSKDDEVNEYLQKNKEKLFYQICIPKSKIVTILNESKKASQFK